MDSIRTFKFNITFIRSWVTEIDGKSEQEAKTYLGFLDTSYLFSYAFFMFLSGIVAERVDLRLFLSLGMMLSGLLTVMFGMAYSLNIHSLWYLLFVQVKLGLGFQLFALPKLTLDCNRNHYFVRRICLR